MEKERNRTSKRKRINEDQKEPEFKVHTVKESKKNLGKKVQFESIFTSIYRNWLNFFDPN